LGNRRSTQHWVLTGIKWILRSTAHHGLRGQCQGWYVTFTTILIANLRKMGKQLLIAHAGCPERQSATHLGCLVATSLQMPVVAPSKTANITARVNSRSVIQCARCVQCTVVCKFLCSSRATGQLRLLKRVKAQKGS